DAVDRLRHPPAPALRRGPFRQGRARRDAAPCHSVLDPGPPRRRRARPRARRAGARGRAAAPGGRPSDESAALVPSRAHRRRGRPGGPRPHAPPPGARAHAWDRRRARARDRLRGAPRTARGARARVPGRGARVRVRARLLRCGRRAGRLRSRLHPRRPLPHHARPPLRRSGLMKILVAVKQVPDTATQVKISADPRAIDTTGITWIVSPYDEYAVEEALRIKEKRGQGEGVAVALGPERVKEALRSCLAMGCDRAIHLNDPAWNDADTLVTSKALAAVVKQEAPQLLLCGRQAIDDDMGAVDRLP